MKLFDIFKKIIQSETDDSHEFKPLLAEIEDAPMNPIGPTIFWLVVSFIVIAFCWLYFAKVDVVVTARGLVIPDGEEKFVQALDKGVVREINVKEGDYVKQGQIVAVVTPADYEPGLELKNLEYEEKGLREQLSGERTRLAIAMDTKNRLLSVQDLIPASRIEDTQKEITELTHDIGRLNAQLEEVQNKRKQIEGQKQELASPIDGYIGQLFIHSIGGVVAPTDKIVSVVPENTELIVKADVLNQDSGFVSAGMPVIVKLDTYNFQKYGVLNGEVTIVSPNSVEKEHIGRVYEIYVKPENKTLMVEGKEEHLKIGMTTTNEIKIGKRRVIEFFIYPLIKYLDESIKVR